MIRVALAIAWREVRLVAYRHAALNALCPVPDDTPSGDSHGGDPIEWEERFRVREMPGVLSAERRAELATETERLARAMLDAEGTR